MRIDWARTRAFSARGRGALGYTVGVPVRIPSSGGYQGIQLPMRPIVEPMLPAITPIWPLMTFMS